MRKQMKPGILQKIADIGEDRDDSIISAIKRDHQSLRPFIDVLKDPKATFAEKKAAYLPFFDLLTSHSTAEKKTIYSRCRELKELKRETEINETEHAVADSLLQAISHSRNHDKWMAQTKVLAELVELHADKE